MKEKNKKLSLWRRIKIAFFRALRERRKYPRVAISVKVTNKWSGNFSYYLALNISAGGLFLKSDEPLALGIPLNLEFSLSPEEEPIQVEAVVVRIQKSDPELNLVCGMGVKFTALSESARERIIEFIEKKI